MDRETNRNNRRDRARAKRAHGMRVHNSARKLALLLRDKEKK